MPFGLLAFTNVLLIFDLRQKTNAVSASISVAKKNQMAINISVVIMTLLFIVFTCPSAIASQYFVVLWNSHLGRIVLFACDDLTFAYHALNIFILSLSNKIFLRELKAIFYKGHADLSQNTQLNTVTQTRHG